MCLLAPPVNLVLTKLVEKLFSQVITFARPYSFFFSFWKSVLQPIFLAIAKNCLPAVSVPWWAWTERCLQSILYWKLHKICFVVEWCRWASVRTLTKLNENISFTKDSWCFCRYEMERCTMGCLVLATILSHQCRYSTSSLSAILNLNWYMPCWF